MSVDRIVHSLIAAGAKPLHVERILRNWTEGRALTDFEPARVPPLPVRAVLAGLAQELDGLLHIAAQHPSADGSVRLLLTLVDGQQIESVLLGRDGVCVSTQVGCAVGCRFCMTGRGGLQRQLSALEIVAQVVTARRLRPVKKVVFMGMGEPAHNMDNVLAALDLLAEYGGIGHKNLVFSTVGDRRVFERLPAGRVKPALALSLHSTKADLRAALLPNAPRIDPAELVELADAYCRTTGYPIQYQWTLIDGVNDGDDEVDGIVRLLKGHYAVMNLIPYNDIEAGEFRRPSLARAEAMAMALYRRGILAKLRQSAGQDIAGACGQLRARAEPRIARVPV